MLVCITLVNMNRLSSPHRPVEITRMNSKFCLERQIRFFFFFMLQRFNLSEVYPYPIQVKGIKFARVCTTSRTS